MRDRGAGPGGVAGQQLYYLLSNPCIYACLIDVLSITDSAFEAKAS